MPAGRGAEPAVRDGVDEDSPLELAYRNESEHLIADRVPLTAALCLGLIGSSGIFEYLLYPDHWQVFLAVYLVGNALKLTTRGHVTVSVLFDARACMLDV